MFDYKNQDDYGLKSVDANGIGTKCFQYQLEFPPQHQNSQPGFEYLMKPLPVFDNSPNLDISLPM